MITDVAFGILVQLIRIDRLPIFDDDMGLLDLRDMIFEDLRSVIQGDWYDRTAAFGRDLNCSVLERKNCQLFSCIPCPFGEDADRNPVFDVVDCLKDCFESFFWILSVKEKAVKTLHPCGESEIALHLFFGNVACQSFVPAVSQQDIKITPVISYEQDRFVRNILLSDHGRLHPGKPEDETERPLNDAERADVPCIWVEFPDDPFHDQDRDSESKI